MANDKSQQPKLTPEQTQRLLRSMRRNAIMMDAMLWLLAIAVVMGAYFQTQSVTATIAIAVPVFSYLVYHTYKQFRIGRD